jgi:cyanophycinase
MENLKNIKKPKGRLIIIGGNEAKKPQQNPSDENEQMVDFSNGVLEEILREIKGHRVIEIIPIASENQDEMGKKYINAFARLKHKAKVMIIKNRKEADSSEILQRLEEADVAFFTGGDQEKLFKTLHNTQFLKVLINKYENDEFIIAGTSSGAMVMGENMIIAGSNDEAVLKGIIELKEGFGIIPNVVIDTHFLSRGRLSRLTEAVLINKNNIGIGICEDTGLIITEGNLLSTVGSGTVVIMEGKNVKNTNYNSLKEKDPVFIENLTLHILAKGAGFMLEQNKFEVFEKKPKREMQEVKA